MFSFSSFAFVIETSGHWTSLVPTAYYSPPPVFVEFTLYSKVHISNSHFKVCLFSTVINSSFGMCVCVCLTGNKQNKWKMQQWIPYNVQAKQCEDLGRICSGLCTIRQNQLICYRRRPHTHMSSCTAECLILVCLSYRLIHSAVDCDVYLERFQN